MPLPIHTTDKPISNVKNIVAIAAGKGGVGKSTVTVNIALALKEAGYSVGVMDTDLYGPSIRKMMPEETMPTRNEQILIPAISSSGIKTMSMAYFSHNDEAVIVRAPIANGYIDQFVNNVAWGDLDVLLIDFPPGTGDIQITLSQKARLTGAVLVTTPQEVAVMDVRKAANLFKKVQIPILGVVENMSYYSLPTTEERVFLFGQGGGKSLAKELGSSFLGEVPIDPEICKRGDDGAHTVFQPFRLIAEKLMGEINRIKGSDVLPEIKQIDDHTLSIKWSDGKMQTMRYNDIQKQCACAHCVDEQTGKRLLDPAAVRSDVRAMAIKSVGRYGLQFKFSSGCSTGIYSFNLLKQIDLNRTKESK